MIESSNCILTIFRVVDISLILLNTFSGMYSILKESKYAAVFWPINQTYCISLLYLSSRFMTCAPFFVLFKLPFEKTPL